MRIGVTFPQIEIGPDPAGVREYALAAEDLGYSHLLAYDHVIGADTASRPDWRGPYTVQSQFHEPFVLFGYLAGITRRLELVTNIVILPQRQTVLAAKQAAEVDVLNSGQFRLGVGLGWNQVEYQALGENFRNRGRRIEEQIAVLRALFTNEVVTFDGRWHRIEAAGINPMPVQRPIPIWMGGSSDESLRRIARIADGWFPQAPPDKSREMVQRVREYVREVGRDPESFGIEARLNIAGKSPDAWVSEVEAWREIGAGYVGVNTMSAGFKGPQQHIDAIRRVKEAIGA